MSVVNLYCNKKHFDMHVSYWFKILELAKEFGWKPKGTRVTKKTKSFVGNWDNWDGNYIKPDFQLVEIDDVKSLVKAIRKATKTLPEQWIWRGNIPTYEMSAQEFFSGEFQKKFLKDFLKFGKEGTFVIG